MNQAFSAPFEKSEKTVVNIPDMFRDILGSMIGEGVLRVGGVSQNKDCCPWSSRCLLNLK